MDEWWDAHNIAQVLQAWKIAQVKRQYHKQVIESNKSAREFKAKMTQGNRKHKMFVSRFEPLALVPAFTSVKGFHYPPVYQKDPSTELHRLQ